MHRRVIALTLAVGLALASCSGDDDTTSAAGDGDTTTTTTVTGEEPGLAGDATTTTAGVGGGTDTTQPGQGDAEGASPTPARPGRYRYELHQDDQAPTETVLVVQQGEDGGSGTLQGHTFLFDGRRRIVRFTADGEIVDSVEVVTDRRYGGASYACDWEPDAIVVPGGALEPGRSWASETACEFDVDGQRVRHEVNEQRQIVARRTVTVAGRDIEVVEIDRVTTLVATGGIGFRQEATATDLYAPALGLVVRSDAAVTIETSGRRNSTRVVLQLLDPEPSAG